MDTGLKGRAAVVTGASRGIGRAIAESLAKEGARLALAATSAERVAETAEACRAHGAEVHTFGVNVGDPEAVATFGKEVAAALGGIDILVNNAGVTRDGLFMRMSEEDWDTVLDINLKGAFTVTKALTRPLLKSKHGRVINIASVVGLMGNPGQANYAASKGGLIAFSKALAKEFGGRGVTVNAVCPGFVQTDMTAELSDEVKSGMLNNVALGRPGRPEDIAGAVTFLASDQGGYVTGQVLVVDGGLRT